MDFLKKYFGIDLCIKCEFGGGGGDEPAKPPARVEYKKEAPREERGTGRKRRALPAQYLSSRRATQSGSGFGGQAKTLG